MSKRTRLYLGIFIALSITGLIALAAYQYKRRGSDAIAFSVDKKLGSEINTVHYTGTRSGKLVWELNADSARLSRRQDMTELDQVKAAFYTGSGSVYRLTAKEGSLKGADGFIDAGGGVVVESEKGERFVTDKLRYIIKSREITSRNRVVFTSEGINVVGSGLVVDVERERFTLLRDVRAVVDDAVR